MAGWLRASVVSIGLRGFFIGLSVMTCTGVWAAIEDQAEQMITAADMGSTKVAISLVDLSGSMTSSSTLIELNADELMIPASNMKILTSAAALKILGPDFVFKTDLRLIESGYQPSVTAQALSETFAGASPRSTELADTDQSQEKTKLPSLVIHADGDPAFGDPELLESHGLTFGDLVDHWVQAVVETGHTEFDYLVVDDRVFDQEFVHPDWPRNQLHRWYCAQIAGLNFHNNVLHVLPQPAHSQGLTAVVDVYPRLPFLTMTNRIKTGKRDDFQLNRLDDANNFSFFGTVRNRATQPHKVTLHDTPILFTRLLQSALAKQGVTVHHITRPGSEDVLPDSQLLHRVQTALPLVLNRTNQDSMNLFAEGLIKRLGYAVTGTPGGWDNGSAAMRSFLTKLLGPKAAVVRVRDGSGMSRQNRVTARLITDLLAKMYQDSRVSATFLSSMARAGTTELGERVGIGTLDDRLTNLKPGVFVYAKTGYISSVNTLSGYLVLPPKSGEQPRLYAFSILLNGWAGKVSYAETKALQDRIIESWQELL